MLVFWHYTSTLCIAVQWDPYAGDGSVSANTSAAEQAGAMAHAAGDAHASTCLELAVLAETQVASGVEPPKLTSMTQADGCT